MLPVKNKANAASGITCSAPSSLQHSAASLILQAEYLQELHCKGIAVIDNAFDHVSMQQLRNECEMLDKAGILLRDDEDVCVPLQRRFDIPLGDKQIIENSRGDAPMLFDVIEHLRGLPMVLEEKLGLQLRVPDTVMLTCYPPGACYKKHLDSYGGRDIPRKVTLLLYCNPNWLPSDGGALRVWIDGETVEYTPIAGRLIIFMAQQVWHEVTVSNAERYALTQWGDVKKDDLGR